MRFASAATVALMAVLLTPTQAAPWWKHGGSPPAPVISAVSSGTPTSSGTTVTWTTDIGSTTQVFYGTTTGYGSNTALDSSLVTSHSQAISGLTASTIYHYKVESVANTKTTDSGDNTFTTTPVVSPNNTVVFAGSAANSITDTNGHVWTIVGTNGGQVAVDGVTDAPTANVVELAYVSGAIWQQNASNNWWSELLPNDSWVSGSAPLPVPLITNASASLSLPTTNGQAVNTVTATNTPTSWSIKSCSVSCTGYFAINNGGQVTVTASGVTNLAAGTYTITANAFNAVGISTGTDIITVTGNGATGAFVVSGGHIIDPNGHQWKGVGVAVYDAYVVGLFGLASGTTLAAGMINVYPKLNFVRLSCGGGETPSDYNTCNTSTNNIDPFVNYMTSRGIVVVIEDHNPNHVVLSGAALTAETNWYAAMATHFLNNKYVMFQTMNEPATGDEAQQLATYNAIRGTGSNAIIWMESSNWSNSPNLIANYPQYAGMHNVGWDYHMYSGAAGNGGPDAPCGTTQANITTCLNSYVTKLNTIPSADGVMPVGAIEFGNSSTPEIIGPTAVQQVDALLSDSNYQATAAWQWNQFNNGSVINVLTQNSGGTGIVASSTTPYGTQVGGYIAAGPGPVSPP